MEVKWSKEKIINQILSIHKRGEKITSHYIQVQYPKLFTAARRHFGSWGKAVMSAGLDYSKISNIVIKNLWSKERIINEIKDAHKKNKPVYLTYVMRNYPHLYRAATNKAFFGSWKKAIESAGLNYNKIRKCHPWMTKEQIIKKLCQMSEEGKKDVPQGVCPMHLIGSIKFHFGTLNKAKKAANLSFTKFHSIKKPLPESAKKPSPEMGYVIGVMLGDGYVEKEKRGCQYRSILEVKDKDFIVFFAKKLEKWIGYKVTVFPPNNKGLWNIKLAQKELNQLLIQYKNNPLLCLDFPIDVQNKVFKGLFDAEGYIGPAAKNAMRMNISNKNEKIIFLLKQILTNNGIIFSVCTQKKKGVREKIKVIDVSRMVDILNIMKIMDGITIQRKYKKVKNRIKKAIKLKNTYYEVMKLSKQGVKPTEIWKKLKKEILLGTIEGWIYRRQKPYAVHSAV